MKRLINFGVAGVASHRFSLIPTTLLVLSSLALTTTVSAAELVINGGFEQPVVTPTIDDFGWMTYYGENQDLGEPDDCPPDDAPTHCDDDVRVPGWSVFWTDDIINHQQLNPGRLEIQSFAYIDLGAASSGVNTSATSFESRGPNETV